MRRRSARAVVLALIVVTACAPTGPSSPATSSPTSSEVATTPAQTPPPASGDAAFNETFEGNTSTRAVKAVSVGWDACAIKLDDTLGCWGGITEPPPSGTYVAVTA